MRIIKEATLKKFAKKFPQAKAYLSAWRLVVRNAEWKTLDDIRQVYPSADPVKVRSGRIVVVFNVCGNKYRFIAAMHYNRAIAYTLKFLTHAEYSKNTWKDDL